MAANQKYIKDGILHALYFDDEGRQMVKQYDHKIVAEVIPQKLYLTESGHLLNACLNVDRTTTGMKIFDECISYSKTLVS